MEDQNLRIAQRYTIDGYKMRAVAIEPSPYSDNVLLMNSVSRFVDSYDLRSMDFIRFSGFNAVKVTPLSGASFYITIEPSEERQNEGY